MSGLEGPALALGASVVRAVVKIWVGDRGVAADVSARAVDLLADRAAGAVQRRRLRRMFDEMEEVVAQRLAPLLEREFAGLADHEKQAAVDAARDTFDRAALDDEDLFAADLDAGYLYGHLVRAVPGMAGRSLLSADAAEFYDRLLRECCAYLVRITTTLPRFQAGVLTELLRRDTETLELVREVLARVPRRRGVHDFEADYRLQVTNALDRMSLFGATVSEPSRRYPLSVAYLSLRVGLGDAVDSPDAGEDIDPEDGTGLASPRRVDELLPVAPRLLVLGEAGSGKTTLLQWTAVRCAAGAVTPFLIRLRRYVDAPLPAPEAFLDEVGRHIAEEMPPGWVHQRLRGGDATVLVDGVDELPEQRRGEVRDWLTELITAFPAARFVVSSRPAALDPGWLRDAEFVHARLQPLTPGDVRALIGGWHEAARAQCVDEDERRALDDYERRLVEAVASRAALRRLARTPLLCALLCALHRDRRGQLPANRMELYEITLHMLLERRDKERGLPSPEGLGRIEKTLLLQDVAYWLVRNGFSDAPTARVAERVAAKLGSMAQVGTDAEAVFRALVERSGLLREPVTGRVDFIHRTFQEYLAAKAAVDADDIGVLVENAHRDEWREVLVMAAGHASRRQREELLTGVIRREDTPTNPNGRRHRQRLALLGAACLETSPELSDTLRAEIRSRVSRLLPPRDGNAALAVAGAGEFVLELLATSDPRSAGTVEATIQAASHIGGDAAMPVIARFGADPRPTVIRQLLEAWPRFDPARYAETVLADSPLLDASVRIDDPDLIAGLVHLRALRHLECRFQRPHGDLTFVAGLPELESLLVTDPAPIDLSPLAGTSLRRLALVPGPRAEPPPVDLAALRDLDTLTRLDLLFASVGRAHLARLPHLSALQLAHLGDATALDELRGLTRLTIVGLRDMTGLRDITPLGFLEAPGWFGLHNCPDLTDVHALGRWAPTLQRLWLRDCPRVDLRGLPELPALDFLDLSGSAATDLTPLTTLRRLETLRLAHHSRPPDLAPLRALPELRRLWLYHSGDIDLSPLAGMPNLTVYASRNQRLHGARRLGPASSIERRSSVPPRINRR